MAISIIILSFIINTFPRQGGENIQAFMAKVILSYDYGMQPFTCSMIILGTLGLMMVSSSSKSCASRSSDTSDVHPALRDLMDDLGDFRGDA